MQRKAMSVSTTRKRLADEVFELGLDDVIILHHKGKALFKLVHLDADDIAWWDNDHPNDKLWHAMLDARTPSVGPSIAVPSVVVKPKEYCPRCDYEIGWCRCPKFNPEE
jgi:hypothetical protein